MGLSWEWLIRVRGTGYGGRADGWLTSQ